MIRFFGHFEGDAQTYRAPGETEANRAGRDCIRLFADKVTVAGALSAADLAALDAGAEALIDAALAAARAAPLPGAADLLTDVYVAY
jgi:pyruvate dehydrogenase E1 component alpha subunit